MDNYTGYRAESCVIDDGAIICPWATIGSDSYIMPGARIGRGAYIGHGSMVYNDATVGANVTIGAGCSIGPCAWIARDVSIPDGSIIDDNQVITQDVISITGVNWPVTLSEHGIKIGCQRVRTPDQWEAVHSLNDLDGFGTEDYRPCLDAAIALWHSYFEWR